MLTTIRCSGNALWQYRPLEPYESVPDAVLPKFTWILHILAVQEYRSLEPYESVPDAVLPKFTWILHILAVLHFYWTWKRIRVVFLGWVNFKKTMIF